MEERSQRIRALGFHVSNMYDGPSEAMYKSTIMFTERDFELVTVPHAGPLVIKLRIANAMVS